MKKIFLLIFCMFFVSFVFAQDAPPYFHEFYGEVFCENGSTFEIDKEMVLVVSDGVEEITSSNFTSLSYYHVIAEGTFDSENVSFYIEDILLGNHSFEIFESTELNFTLSMNDYCFVEVEDEPDDDSDGDDSSGDSDEEEDQEEDLDSQLEDDAGNQTEDETKEETSFIWFKYKDMKETRLISLLILLLVLIVIIVIYASEKKSPIVTTKK